MYLKNKILSRQEKYCIAVLKEKIKEGEKRLRRRTANLVQR